MARQAMETPNLPKVKRILYLGMSGPDVKFIQERLGYVNSIYQFCPNRELSNTGYFGKDTHRFVTFFQIFADLATDGWVDKATADSLEEFAQAIARVYEY